jgi:hypothetical protein
MADGTYQPKVYRANGGDGLVVASGGTIKMETGAKLVPNSGTQAANITAIATTGTFATGIAAKINAMRVALINVGILATS